MGPDQDPVERFRRLASESPGLRPLVVTVGALTVGCLMAGVAMLIGVNSSDVLLIGILGGFGAVPAMLLYTR